MSNQLRGEIEIKLGEQTYNCKLNFDSLVRIENTLDTPILKLAQKISPQPRSQRILPVAVAIAVSTAVFRHPHWAEETQ